MKVLEDSTVRFLGCVLDGMWPADKAHIPEKIKASLDRYVNHGLRTGGFLEAVLSNDLMDAYRRADRDDLVMMPAIVSYIYSDIPSDAHGSRERYEAWLTRHRERLLASHAAMPVDNVND